MTNQQNSNKGPAIGVVLGLLIAIIVSIMMVVNLGKEFSAGGGGYIGFIILGLPLGVVFGFIGSVIGETVRGIACPDAIFTSGGMGTILKEKLFWAIGPQCIGGFVGGAAGSYLGCLVIMKLFF